MRTKQRQGAWTTHTQASSRGTLTETAALWPLHTLQCSQGSICDPLTKSQRSSRANTLYPLSFGVCRDTPLDRLLIFIHMFLLKVRAALQLRDKEFKGFLCTFVYVWVSELVFSRVHGPGNKCFSSKNIHDEVCEFGRLCVRLFFTSVTCSYCISAFYLLVRKNLFTFGIPVSSERWPVLIYPCSSPSRPLALSLYSLPSPTSATSSSF